MFWTNFLTGLYTTLGVGAVIAAIALVGCLVAAVYAIFDWWNKRKYKLKQAKIQKERDNRKLYHIIGVLQRKGTLTWEEAYGRDYDSEVS